MMSRKIVFIFLIFLLVIAGLCFFQNIEALGPSIDVTVSPDPARHGQTVSINVIVTSQYRLQDDRVQIRWGDGLVEEFACVMPLDYDLLPGQVCSFSAQHIYGAEGDYFAIVLATDTQFFADSVPQTIHVSGAAIATGYDNPLLAENIPQFVWQAIVFLFTASLYIAPLMIIIGAYVMVSSGGIPSRIDKGKKIIIWTLIAFAIILISRGLIQLVWMLLGG